MAAARQTTSLEYQTVQPHDCNFGPCAPSWPRNQSVVTLSRYGLTPDDYDRILLAQGCRCATCDRITAADYLSRKQLLIDHCHTCGEVRGLVCSGCNGAIGRVDARRSGRSVTPAHVDYVQRHSAVCVGHEASPTKRRRAPRPERRPPLYTDSSAYIQGADADPLTIVRLVRLTRYRHSDPDAGRLEGIAVVIDDETIPDHYQCENFDHCGNYHPLCDGNLCRQCMADGFHLCLDCELKILPNDHRSLVCNDCHHQT